MVIGPISYDDKPKAKAQAQPQGDVVEVHGVEKRLASPADRFSAFVADGILLHPVISVIVSPLKRFALEAQMAGDSTSYHVSHYSSWLLGVLVFVLYHTVFVAWWGATPGKRALGLRVEPIWGEGPKPNPLSAFFRAGSIVLETLCLGLPWISIFSNERRRPFHDRVSDTVVTADRKHRAVGIPSLNEISMAKGVSAAFLLMIGIVASVQLYLLKASFEGDLLVADLEESGNLCRAVGEAEKAWIPPSGEAKPARLSVALTLFAADSIDESCLKQEADFALWRDDDKSNAYLARGLAETKDGTLAQEYMMKVCETKENSDACRAVTIESGPAEADDLAEAKSNEAEFETQVDSIASRALIESEPFLGVMLVKHFAVSGRDDRAIAFIESLPPQKALAYFLTSERAKALWNLDRKLEARLAMNATTDVADPSERVDITQWFCERETEASGCSKDAKKACDILSSVVDNRDVYLLHPDVVVTYLKGESCSERLDSERLADLESKIDDDDGRHYVQALHELVDNKPEKARELLNKVASTSVKSGPYFIEANTKLAELANSEADLKEIHEMWSQTDPKQNGWRLLGRRLMERYNGFHDWEQSVDIGLQIAEKDTVDTPTARSMVVAAYRAGRVGMATSFLDRLQQASGIEKESPDPVRAPASHLKSETKTDSFEEVARLLSHSRKGAR